MDNNFFNKKNMIIRKIEPGIQSFEINKKISEYFLDPNKYLLANSNLIIGKKVTGPRYDSDNKLIPFSIIGTLKEFQRTEKSNSIIRPPMNSLMKTLSQKTRIESPKEKKNYINITETDFNKVCQNTQNRVNHNSKSPNKFLENIPSITKEKLITQEKILELNLNREKEKENIKRALSNYSKKNPNDLLMSKSEFYRTKKELREMNERTRPLDQKYGCNTWIMSLRRPPGFKGTRFVNVNIGTSERPIWRVVKEHVGFEIGEKIRKPRSGNLYRSGNYFYSNGRASEIGVCNLEDKIDELEVVGINLLSEEFKNVNCLKGKKIMYKNEADELIKQDEIISEDYIKNSPSNKIRRVRTKSEISNNSKNKLFSL